jgi:hypothetical protein
MAPHVPLENTIGVQCPSSYISTSVEAGGFQGPPESQLDSDCVLSFDEVGGRGGYSCATNFLLYQVMIYRTAFLRVLYDSGCSVIPCLCPLLF